MYRSHHPRLSDELIFRRVETSLQLLSCVATFSTFLRVIFEQELPAVFAFVPAVLPAVFLLRYCTPLADDITTLAMLTGAALGVISGFLSGIVREYAINHDAASLHSFTGDLLDSKKHHGKIALLYNLEFLHLPVICGSILYSYCLVFDKLPSVRATRQALFSAFVGAMVWTAGFVIALGSASSYTLLRVFMFSFAMVFLAVYMTVVREHQKPWLTAVIILCAYLYWESSYFDTLIWDFAASRFPIPGSIAAMVIVFVVQLHKASTSARIPHTVKDHNVHSAEDAATDVHDVHLTVLVWQTITYVTEHISLAVIQNSKAKVSGEVKDQWGIVFSCLTMSAFVGVMSAFYRESLLFKVYIVISLLFLYLVLSLSAMVLHNGYFTELILGYTIALATHPR